MDIFNVLTLVGGLCLFLFGMNLMGQALERRAGGKLRSLLDKMTSRVFVGFLTGLGITAIIRRFIGTICEPTPISKYLFLWREAVFRHSLPFLFMRPQRIPAQLQLRPCSVAVRPPDRCHGSRCVPPAVLCGNISPRALRLPPV